MNIQHPKRKCIECGFLAFRTSAYINMSLPLLAEADQGTRDVGYNSKNDLYEYSPICFMREATFMKEKREIPINDVVPVVQQMLTRERCCLEFTEWQQGFSPKEHREMLDRQWVLDRQDRLDQEQREREDRRDREQRDFQTQMATSEHDFQERMANDERDWRVKREGRRLRWDIVIFGGLVTLALIAAQFVSVLVERGSLWGSGPTVMP